MSMTFAPAVVIPNYGLNAHSCVQENHGICWSWLSQNWSGILWPALRQHIVLTAIAIGVGFVISMTMALLAHRYGKVEKPVSIFASVLYTIPSLALFEVLVGIRTFGLSRLSVEIALVGYTLLILFRNTLAGLRGVPDEVREAAQGMGLTRGQILRQVELPLAVPAIIAGLRIATVTIVSLATIAVAVINQGLGVPIVQAINNQLFKTELYAAALLAVGLAVTADLGFYGLQRLLTPWARRAR
jgi:osmoprotectant transport system permease protein